MRERKVLLRSGKRIKIDEKCHVCYRENALKYLFSDFCVKARKYIEEGIENNFMRLTADPLSAFVTRWQRFGQSSDIIDYAACIPLYYNAREVGYIKELILEDKIDSTDIIADVVWYEKPNSFEISIVVKNIEEESKIDTIFVNKADFTSFDVRGEYDGKKD